MMDINRRVALLLLLFNLQTVSAQITGDSIYVGKPLSGITFTRLEYSEKPYSSTAELRGKWLILDFFSSGCVSCFESLPKMNKIRIGHKDSIEIIMVGLQDKYIRPMFERSRKKNGLQLPVYYDTSLFNRFDIGPVPYIIVADPNGIVRAITISISESELLQLMSGKNPGLVPALSRSEYEKKSMLHNWASPLYIDGNGGDGSDFLYRSILSKWNGKIEFGGNFFIRSALLKNRVEVVGVGPSILYNMAYGDTMPYGVYAGSNYGKYWKEPIFEHIDSAQFEVEDVDHTNRFVYSMIVPAEKATTIFLRSVMQSDLKNYFGFAVRLEERLMPCWILTADAARKHRLISKEDRESLKYSDIKGWHLRNMPVMSLIEELWYNNFYESPFIDETGIFSNIDLDLNVEFNNLEDVITELKKKGLKLERGRKLMKVVVVSKE